MAHEWNHTVCSLTNEQPFLLWNAFRWTEKLQRWYKTPYPVSPMLTPYLAIGQCQKEDIGIRMILLVNYRLYLGFIHFSTDVFFFFSRSSPRSHMTFSCPVSLISPSVVVSQSFIYFVHDLGTFEGYWSSIL